jgi:hypothetical protein
MNLWDGLLGSPQINSINAGAPNYAPADIIASTESPAPTSAKSIAHPAPVLQPNKIQDSSPANLAARWEALIVDHYGDYVPPFTKKEFGQLKGFIQACPPGQALSTLECCLRDWVDFAGYAKAEYAAFAVPPRPTLDFLMKYRAAAINFALKEAKEAAMPKGTVIEPPKKKTMAPAYEPTVEIPEEEPAMTYEDMLALSDDGNSDTGSHAAKVGLGAGIPMDEPAPTPEEIKAILNGGTSVTGSHAVEVGVTEGHKKHVVKKPKDKGLTYDEMMQIVGDEYYANFEFPT